MLIHKMLILVSQPQQQHLFLLFLLFVVAVIKILGFVTLIINNITSQQQQ